MAGRLSIMINKKVAKGNRSQKAPAEAAGLAHMTNDSTKKMSIYPKQLIAGTGQSIGLHRDHNEDALFSLTCELADGKIQQEFGLFIIADGMGGHRNGEIASSVACRVISRFIIQKFIDVSTSDDFDLSEEDWKGHLDQAIAEAQQAVLKHAPGGGTTATAAIWSGDKVIVAQVGDSRAYFVLPDGRLEKITTDHSLVQRLVDLNEITESEADVHPQKNVLLRAIGQPDPLKADVNKIPIPVGAKLMLCSDGLWGVVDEAAIAKTVLQIDDPVAACGQLVAAANARGGPDNISVIIAGLKE